MIEMNEHQYEALLGWARLAADETGDSEAFWQLRKAIDLANDVQRYTLVIRYDTLPHRPVVLGQAPFGETKVLELPRKPTYDDVIAALQGERYAEPQVYVTVDPNARVGWYELAKFPWE